MHYEYFLSATAVVGLLYLLLAFDFCNNKRVQIDPTVREAYHKSSSDHFVTLMNTVPIR